MILGVPTSREINFPTVESSGKRWHIYSIIEAKKILLKFIWNSYTRKPRNREYREVREYYAIS